MKGGSDTFNSNMRWKMLSVLIAIQTEYYESPAKVGLILTGTLTEQVVFKWDLEGLE